MMNNFIKNHVEDILVLLTALTVFLLTGMLYDSSQKFQKELQACHEKGGEMVVITTAFSSQKSVCVFGLRESKMEP